MRNFLSLLVICISALSFYGGTCHNTDLGSLAEADFIADPTDITLNAGGAGVPVRFTVQVDQAQKCEIGKDTAAGANPGNLELHLGYCHGTSCMEHKDDYVIDTLFAPAGKPSGTYTFHVILYYVETIIGSLSKIHIIDGVSLTVHIMGKGLPFTMTDSTFEELHWAENTLLDSSKTGVSSISRQILSGGRSGQYRQTIINWNGGPDNRAIIGEIMSTAVYSPLADGAFTYIDYSWDRKDSTSSAGVRTVPAVSLLLEQDNKFYIGLSHFGGGSTWYHEGFTNRNSAGFSEIFPGRGSHPDFSASAKPITFGYAVTTAINSTDHSNAAVVSIDNWKVILHN